jgi:membrane protease YdiL (CAAX protease family)
MIGRSGSPRFGRDGRAARPLAELTAMTILILSYIWLWQDSFPGDFLLCVILYAGIGTAAHLRSGESPRSIGFRADNLGPALLQVLLFVGPLALVPLLAGGWLGSLNWPDESRGGWAAGSIWRILWGTAQQYGLLAFYFRRTSELLRGPTGPMVVTSLLFALFHLPNPFLTIVTFLAGLLSCWLYRRVPNLWALGLAHGVLSISLARSLPPEITFGMRVGPGFWHFLEALH